MKIIRDGKEIQLTAEELRMAQKEQEMEDIKVNFRYYLIEEAEMNYDFSDEQIREIIRKHIDSAVNEFLRRKSFDTEREEDIWQHIVERILYKEVAA